VVDCYGWSFDLQNWGIFRDFEGRERIGVKFGTFGWKRVKNRHEGEYSSIFGRDLCTINLAALAVLRRLVVQST